MSKANDPAFPNREGDLISATDACTVRERNGVKGGLSKLEYACIKLRVPKTGDPELDAVIREANLRDAAAYALKGLPACPHWEPETVEDGAKIAVKFATALISELEKVK